MNVLVDPCAGPGLWSIDAAFAAVTAVKPVDGVETVGLGDAAGRIAARDVTAASALPRFDQSAMDGYGIQHADVAAGRTGPFPVDGAVRAGGAPGPTLAPGRAVRLLTGAALPDGVGAVVMEERVDASHGSVLLHRPAEPGQNIRRRGEDIAAGTTVAGAGDRLDARHVALLAACGSRRVEVARRVRVGVLSTGNELAEPGDALPESAVYDSNRPMLLALLASPSCEVVDLGCVRDDPAVHARRLSQVSTELDLVVSSGGVSGSDADHAVRAIEAAGGRAVRAALAMKPGKPVAFGRIGGCAMLCLPGNPVAAMVGGLLFARPLALGLAGAAARMPAGMAAVTVDTFHHRPGRIEYVPASVTGVDGEGRFLVRKLGKGGSARLAPLVAADGLAAIPADAADLPAGCSVRFFPLRCDSAL